MNDNNKEKSPTEEKVIKVCSELGWEYEGEAKPKEYDLKAEIKSLGMNQIEFSKIVKVHNNTLTQWIKKKRKMPNWIVEFIYYYRKAKLFDEFKDKITEVESKGGVDKHTPL